jgi:hypothetical protein
MIIYPSSISTPAAGVKLIDFGKDAFARLELELTRDCVKNIEVCIGEVLTNGRLNRTPGDYRCFKSFQLQLKQGKHIYQIEIPPHQAPNPALPKLYPPKEAGGEIAPFRYVEITGYEGEIIARQMAVFAPFNDQAASFKCSDERLNRIWEFCKYSIKATSAFGMYIDGERERLPYEGDTYINQLGHFCCDCDYSMARRTIEYLLKHPTWPTEWSLIMIPVVFEYYLYSGDIESFERWKPQLYEKLCLDRIGDDGMLLDNGKDIVDWPAGERDGYELGKINLVPNCYLYHALILLGENEKAAILKNNIRQKFFRNGLFIDNTESRHNSLHGNMFAVRFGIAEQMEYPFITEFIRSKGMSCSVYGAQFLLETCYKCGLANHALSLLTSDGLRSWLHMLNCGATITKEVWDDSLHPCPDWNHAWGAAPANIIPRGLFGIKPLKPGFEVFQFKPQPASLQSAQLRHPTPHGPIEIELNRKEIQFSLPSGTTAQVELPGEPVQLKTRSEVFKWNI